MLKAGDVKTLQELINRAEPAWPLVQRWATEATNPVELLPPPDDSIRGQALVDTQVTTRSPLGAVIYGSGGILVDYGWLRFLGSGHARLPRSLPGWNIGRACSALAEPPPFLLIADDVLGGFFAIDGGGLGLEAGKICYFAPDTMIWESTGKGYSDFLNWAFRGDLARYYHSMRWTGWEEDARTIRGDQGFVFILF